jgi:hypothetical protein
MSEESCRLLMCEASRPALMLSRASRKDALFFIAGCLES